MLTSCLMLQWFQSWDDRGEDVELHCELGVLDNSLSVSSHSAPRSLEPIFSPLLKQYSVCQGSEDFESQARSHGYIMSVTRCSIWIQAYLARDTEAMSCGPRVSSVSMSRLREMLLSQRIYEKLCVTFHARHLKTWEQPCLVRCWELRRRRQWGVRSEPWWMTGISRKVLSEVLITRRCTIDVRESRESRERVDWIRGETSWGIPEMVAINLYGQPHTSGFKLSTTYISYHRSFEFQKIRNTARIRFFLNPVFSQFIRHSHSPRDIQTKHWLPVKDLENLELSDSEVLRHSKLPSAEMPNPNWLFNVKWDRVFVWAAPLLIS